MSIENRTPTKLPPGEALPHFFQGFRLDCLFHPIPVPARSEAEKSGRSVGLLDKREQLVHIMDGAGRQVLMGTSPQTFAVQRQIVELDDDLATEDRYKVVPDRSGNRPSAFQVRVWEGDGEGQPGFSLAPAPERIRKAPDEPGIRNGGTLRSALGSVGVTSAKIAECRAKLLEIFAAYLNLGEADDLYCAAGQVPSLNPVHGDPPTMKGKRRQPDHLDPTVIPAKAGIQRCDGLDPGFRRGDVGWASIFNRSLTECDALFTSLQHRTFRGEP